MADGSGNRPAKKLKKWDFNLCLICNTKKTGIHLDGWNQHSWHEFCSAAKRTQDETFTRLESFISGREQPPDELPQLKKHEDCYSKYINPNQFGITPPPLLNYLKDILRDYSDGQIIKELVQNAEDAGAETVKFLYDVRQYGTETLYKPSLASYQGPAFYSFNSAKFKEKDWGGIQKPARSNKKSDRLKVGRFGIGFNSVYHITDIPSIMSDKTLAFIDPLEEHFLDRKGRVQTGYRFDLSSDGETLTQYKDQFEPYQNIFPQVKEGISKGHFDGTLFRFPLRSNASELSDKTYNDEIKMDELLQAFRVDADVVMLFLRSLNNIELLKRPSGQKEPSLVVRVQREHDQDPAPEDLSRLLTSYCDNIRGERESIEMTGSVTFATETQETSKTQRWVVSHHIAGDSVSEEISDLAEKQSHLPWVAVAVPMINTTACEPEDSNIGRVFCFLPLPPGEESRTGLPVHIHGFFGVNSDRRGIKWPGPDQTDDPAQWNRLLVSELIPIAYVQAIKHAISIHTSEQGVTTHCIYRSWPDHEAVNSNWNILLEPFYNTLFKEAIVHSDNQGWMNIANIHFNDLTVDKDTEKLICKCFDMGGIAYATVPTVCRRAIKKFYKGQTSTISAPRLCQCLREHPSILQKLTAEEKLLVLEFILNEKAVQDLQGLPLLPLDDDSFHIFSDSEETVYIPTSQFHRQLVPGGYQQFIRTIPKEQQVHQLLSKMDGCYQLKSLNLDAVARLLKAGMETWTGDQGKWLPDTQGPSQDAWLKEVWAMLYRESSSKLLLFEGIPLVPLINAHEEIEKLLPLLPNSIVIQRSQTSDGDNAFYTDDLVNVLQQLGVTVTSCPEYILAHPAVKRDEYIKMPTPEGVVRCLLQSDVEVLIEKVKSISSSHRDILTECLAQAKLSGDGKKFLGCLPLFEPVAGTGSSNEPLVSVEKCKGYIECCLTDIPSPLKLVGLLIDGRAKSKSLLQTLQVCRLSKHQVIMDVLYEIDDGKLYSVEEKQLILQWIMARWADINVNCEGIKDILCRLKVIPNLKKSLMCPSEFLDPSDHLLQELFASQAVFPGAPFDSPDAIAAFKQLGMRGQDEITAEEVIDCVDVIEKSNCPIKARKLLHLLNINPALFQNSLDDGTVAKIMKDRRIIPCDESPPEYYPSDIQWHGNTSSCLSTPLEILIETKKAVLLSGASRSFISHQDLFPTAFEHLELMSNTPRLSDAIEQLENCVKYTKDRTDQDVTDIIPMVKEIYSFLMDTWQQDSDIRSRILDHLPYCIWNGNGFSEPSKMCSDELPFDLAPYMASIPKSTSAFKDLFEALGVRKNMDTNSDALVEVLHEIKRVCDNPEADATFKQKQRQIVLQILHRLKITGELSEDAQRQLLVPSHREGCHLIPVKESAYVDKDWLRQSTDDEEMDNAEDFMLIHPDISMDLAIFLNVQPVSRLLLESEELEGFTQAGQQEKLTMRLYNILQNNHMSNAAIVNEMIQNAEDAGAHEVRFLIDMRKNENANKKLFDPGMKSCQGPALWVYNDAIFTDEDFENILRLGGRTKEKNAEKIGKFGTGFNSVYHITDVPSFVSREYVQFFDPHTTHLGNVLRNPSQPGVRLKLNSTKQLRRFPDQFQPFNGVFGLDFKDRNYCGTLFRLPLRSEEGAQESLICKESCDGEKLIGLMQKMWESSRDLLVFTRKITKVAVFHLGEHASDPAEAEELFTIQKTIDPESNRHKDYATVLSTESFHYKMTPKGNEIMLQAHEVDEHLTTVRVLCKTSEQAASLAQSPHGRECGLLPEGSVAFPFHRQPVSALKKQLYCYLPLSIFSTFPVHVNGSFAVKEDRRSLHMPVPDSEIISEKWNHILLADVICRAYVSLLSDAEFLQQLKNTYGSDFCHESLWPDIDEVPKNSACSALFDAFYKAMIQGLDGHEPSLFWKDGKVHQITKVVFLAKEVQKEKSISDVVMKVLQDHLTSIEVMTLTEKTWRAVDRVGLRSEVITRTYDFRRFFDEVFLPQISQVPEDMRNRLILFALNHGGGKLRQKLKDVACIPVVGSTELRKPCDLVHPKGEAAPLFSESDKVFPLGEKFNTSITLASLSQLGMIKDYLSENTFVERCETVPVLHSTDPTLARKRCHAVLEYLSGSLRKREWNRNDRLRDRLKGTSFLPLLPENNKEKSLPWMEINDSCAYMSAEDVYSYSRRYLVSSTSYVVDKTEEWQLPESIEGFLGLADKYPSIHEVFKHFLNFRNYYEKTSDCISDFPLESICKAVYKVINIASEVNCPDFIKERLQEEPLFLQREERKFVEASKIAKGGHDLPPYLFKASPFLNQFPHLMRHAALKSEFDDEDYQKVLRSIYMENCEQALDDDLIELAITAAGRLSRCIEKDIDVFLPDEYNYMRPVSELCYCDVSWFENKENKLHVCHENISAALAKKLQVKDIRQQMLMSYDMTFPGEEFGQQEELTNRLKRILESYPSDDTILKELLQNADDAGATEIHFVYDPWTHDGEKIFGDRMQSLQGPSLCVFNNRSFSDADIRGIQNLGEGSKADHMGKIGRYGVGFNAVYQLTDCPSFISNHANGNKLCIFDPLLEYVPGASASRPGRLIRVNDFIRDSYPDVFPCYLEEELSHGQDDFTVFRFPLRQETSKLSKNVWQAGKIRKLLEDFEMAAFESLLFLKHVTKISISEVTESGAIGSTKSICAEMSTLECEKKTNFLGKVHEFATQSNDDLEPEQAGVVYQMKLKGDEREEDWVICQQVGSAEKGLESSLHKHKLLPVGAAAARLTDIKEGFKGRAFCFLPLPISTGLPVHVHGYFALDHESRRHLWEGKETDEQTKWNCHIIQHIIAPAYVTLLSWIQEFFVRKYEWSGMITGEQAVRTLLQKYHTFFPISDKGFYWKELGNTVYEVIASKALQLFPCIYRDCDGQFSLKWKTPMQSRDESDMGYFNTLPDQISNDYDASPSRNNIKKQEAKQLKETLLDITFPLLESPTRIMGRLRKACERLKIETIEYEVLKVLPSNVISFLHSDNPLQRQLPMVLSGTRIHDEESLMRIIDYCKEVKGLNISETLNGLPLLLTEDGILRRFSHDEQVFVSDYYYLFKEQSHRFLHKGFLHKLPRKADVFCDLDVTAVSVLLHKCTPFLECDSDEIMLLDEHLSPDWFGRLWSLLESFCQKEVYNSTIADVIKAKLSHWAILPVTQVQNQVRYQLRSCPNQVIKQVAPVSLASTIIIPPGGDPKEWHWPIYSALKSLNVYEVESSILHEENYRLIQQLVTHKDANFRILDVLMYWLKAEQSRFENLNQSQHKEILEYFRCCDTPKDLDRLKSLPCFETIGGEFVSIAGRDKVLVLPSRIPRKEQKTWVDTTNVVFLQYNERLEPLYKRLRLADTTEIDVYVEYILPVFIRISEDSRLEHLKRVQELIPLDSKLRRGTIWRLRLTELCFITGADGEIMKAADFYDRQNETFSLMLTKSHFPPPHIEKCLGLPFLREMGLQVDVTRDLYLSFAKQIHESDPKEMKRKSYGLVTELKCNCKLHGDVSFLRKVSQVDFLVSDKISKDMESIHPPYMKAGALTSYCKSTSSNHSQLIWSTNSILPTYATLGKCWSCLTTFDGKIDVATEPKLESVIEHTRNVCKGLEKRNDKKFSFPEQLVSVLYAIFTFLLSKCGKQGCCQEKPCDMCFLIKIELQNVPIVFLELEDEHRLVKAEQISRTIEENLEPFLFQLPDKWVPFLKIFRILGGSVKPTMGQYASVLESIYKSGKTSWSIPNIIKIIERATGGLYQELKKADPTVVAAAFVPEQCLYLPSRQNTLARSDHLLMNDVPHFESRLRKSKQPFIKIFPRQKEIMTEAIAKLPDNMKPKAVSKEVRELLCMTGNDSQNCVMMNGDEPCELKRRLQILHSKEFLNAVCCMLRNKKQKVDEETKEMYKDRLSRLGITCMQQLHSILQINGEAIAGSETEVLSFIKDENELFVKHSEGESRMETLLSVAIHVNQFLGNVLDNTHLSILLSQESPATIPKALARFNIPAEMIEEDTSFQLPPPGSTIPEQLYHLIEQDPWTSFKTGDYVAYAHTDGDDEYYIYAVVVKRISNESLRSLYHINIGTGSSIEANVLDMHKIHIPQSISGKEIVPSENESSGGAFPSDVSGGAFPCDVEDAKQQVTRELEEIWQLPEEQKRKALRRLMLKWHPDKHPESLKDLFHEAFKHLRSEIQRLEELSGRNSQYEDVFRAAQKRAREDRERYTHFEGFTYRWRTRRGPRSRSGNSSRESWNYEHFFKNAPDIRNARRWLRQGLEDLRAAKHDLDPVDEPSLEWVAYKCHQSVEKALKAAQIAIRGHCYSTHLIYSLASDVSHQCNNSHVFLENVRQLSTLVQDQRARYPDQCAFSEIPHEAFNDEAKAREMLRLAESILGEVQKFVHSR